MNKRASMANTIPRDSILSNHINLPQNRSVMIIFRIN